MSAYRQSLTQKIEDTKKKRKKKLEKVYPLINITFYEFSYLFWSLSDNEQFASSFHSQIHKYEFKWYPFIVVRSFDKNNGATKTIKEKKSRKINKWRNGNETENQMESRWLIISLEIVYESDLWND